MSERCKVQKQKRVFINYWDEIGQIWVRGSLHVRTILSRIICPICLQMVWANKMTGLILCPTQSMSSTVQHPQNQVDSLMDICFTRKSDTESDVHTSDFEVDGRDMLRKMNKIASFWFACESIENLTRNRTCRWPLKGNKNWCIRWGKV